ncbi:DNA helicase [Paramicrosporidium saccamoebae]|uniref:DNA replication licensing factor MCM2 n=1 Tax=Paramicrosporidium saccamoebae TaxID=1246581 RepID=A0A2H9TQ44_9FUNG|nr:DNA helicase [Paramicrosporidium saccamoebae]
MRCNYECDRSSGRKRGNAIDSDSDAPPEPSQDLFPRGSGDLYESDEVEEEDLTDPRGGELATNELPTSTPNPIIYNYVVPPLATASEISYPDYCDWEGLDSALGMHRTAPPVMTDLRLEDATLTELETAGYTLTEIVSEAKFRRRIARDYQRFLTTFTDEVGQSVYNSRIRAMCAANSESLEVSYLHLVETNAFLAKLLANVPLATLAIFDEATMRIVLRLFEEYDKIKSEIHVRITDFPTLDSLRDLRYNHLGTMIKVSGVVTRRSGVFPQLKLVKYDCGKCGAILGPYVQDLNQEIRISACSECEARGPFTINAAQTVYRNYQKLTLQESPGSVPAGRLPRHKEVILLWDLIDCARPGELVEVTGIYRNNFSYMLNSKNGFPVFSTVIEANWIGKRADQFAEFRLTEEDQREIRRLAEDPHIGLRIIRSIAPSIYGHQDIKTAIALALFGGQAKNAQGKHVIRGDINVLLLGDPGTAKSQFLKYVEKTAHRAVYTTGQGASAVGLTASVRKDPLTREWTLEGGALVLADKGVCLIDEFDKMNDSDRTSIHEAMEQQSISISKAGIVTSLQARCSIIAAANPTRGRYNSALPFSQNVHLTEPILSRFDILCVVRDTVDATIDERLARFVVGSHIRSHPEADTILADTLQADTLIQTVEPLPQPLLKKYLLYAKSRIRPELSQMDVDKIARLYADLRRESLATGSIPITVRHIESLVRMSEAHARMHLRDHVRSDDIDLAIRVMLSSFIQSQKYSVMTHLRRAFGKYITHRKEHGELLLFALQELVNERIKLLSVRYSDELPGEIEIDMPDFEARAKELNVYDIKPFLSSRFFTASGCRVDLDRRVIVKSL